MTPLVPFVITVLAFTTPACPQPERLINLRTSDHWQILETFSRPDIENLITTWTIMRDWQHLQALAFIAFLCQRPILAQQAFQLAREAYLSRGGITAYAQDPQVFPWWVFWDTLFLNHQLTPEEAWNLYRLGSSWTPNLWDRTVRSRVLAEWLRQQRSFSLLRQLKQKEDQLADQFRDYRVDPLTWQTMRHLIYACEPWLVLAFTVWLGLILPLWLKAKYRTLLAGSIVLWLFLIFFAYTYPAWLESSYQAWMELRHNLLAGGFVSSEVPAPWRDLLELRISESDLPQNLRKEYRQWRDSALASVRRYYPTASIYNPYPYRELLTHLRQRSLTPISQNPVVMEKWWDMASSLPRTIPPAPWSLLHGIYPLARWYTVLLRAKEIFLYQLKNWIFIWLLGPLLVCLVPVRKWLKPFIPGLSRLEANAPFHGILLYMTAVPSLFALVAISTLPMHRMWGSLLDHDWLNFIDSLGRTRIIVWGGLYLTVLGITLMAWTLHFMAYFVDRYQPGPQHPDQQDST